MEVFFEISIIFVIAAIVALVMQILRQPLVLGHILTGIIVGPAVFDLIRNQETIQVFSQLGITALLFIIGLNLNPRIIREVGKVAVITGLGQILITTGLGYLIGRAFGQSPIIAFYIALAFTFSSTIIISKMLADRKDLWQLHGKIAIGLLLVQDIVATIFLLIISSIIQGGEVGDIIINTGLRGVVVGAVLCVVVIYVLPILTGIFARSKEFLFIFAIAWGIGLAAFFQALGLSIELGALIAGVALASSPYHYEISAKMSLMRDFFIVMFFILLGSQLSYGNISQFLGPIIVFSLFVIIVKPIIVMTIMGLLNYSKRTSFKAGLTVAQISEFSLVLVFLAIRAGHLPPEYLSLATIVGMITISISTVMLLYADELYVLLAPALSIFERSSFKKESRRKERYDAILFGCHRVGSDFLPSLEQWGGNYIVVDFDPAVIQTLTEKGIPNRYGDAGENAFLEDIDLKKLKLAISTIPDFETNLYLVQMIRDENPDAVLIALGHNIDEAEELYATGAHYVILPQFIGGNYAAMLVSKFGHDASEFKREREKHLKHLGERKDWKHVSALNKLLEQKEIGR